MFYLVKITYSGLVGIKPSEDLFHVGKAGVSCLDNKNNALNPVEHKYGQYSENKSLGVPGQGFSISIIMNKSLMLHTINISRFTLNLFLSFIRIFSEKFILLVFISFLSIWSELNIQVLLDSGQTQILKRIE